MGIVNTANKRTKKCLRQKKKIYFVFFSIQNTSTSMMIDDELNSKWNLKSWQKRHKSKRDKSLLLIKKLIDSEMKMRHHGKSEKNAAAERRGSVKYRNILRSTTEVIFTNKAQHRC